MNETRQQNTTGPRLGTAAGNSGVFLKGLVAGGLIGTAAGVLFAPQISAALCNMRRQLEETAAGASDAAAGQYREATTRLGDAVDDLQQQGRAVYGNALTAVVERAIEARSELDQRAASTPRRS
jgi:gas vesicle protein